jgi:hypothetical protein
VYIRKNVIEKEVAILSACFVPNLQNNLEKRVQWQEKSQLFFLNSEQVYLTFFIISYLFYFNHIKILIILVGVIDLGI